MKQPNDMENGNGNENENENEIGIGSSSSCTPIETPKRTIRSNMRKTAPPLPTSPIPEYKPLTIVRGKDDNWIMKKRNINEKRGRSTLSTTRQQAGVRESIHKIANGMQQTQDQQIQEEQKTKAEIIHPYRNGMPAERHNTSDRNGENRSHTHTQQTKSAQHKTGEKNAKPKERNGNDGESPIFEHFLVIGARFDAEKTAAEEKPCWLEEARILLRFPHDRPIEELDVARFAFPEDVLVERLQLGSDSMEVLYEQKHLRSGDHHFIFTLQQSHVSEQQTHVVDASYPELILPLLYGVCIRVQEITTVTDIFGRQHDLSCPVVYCFLTRYPFFRLHFEVLEDVLRSLHLKRLQRLATFESPDTLIRPVCKPLGPHQVSACIAQLKAYMHSSPKGPVITVPRCGMHTGDDAATFVMERPVVMDECSYFITHYACYLAWQSVAADHLIDLLECAVREFKIIVACDNLALLTNFVLSFVTMLSPLRWQGVFLSILPLHMREFLDAPVPYIIGVTHLSKQICLELDMAIWWPSLHELHLSTSFKRLMPDRSKLLRRLRSQLSLLAEARQSAVSVNGHHHQSICYHPSKLELRLLQDVVDTLQTAVVDLIDYLHETRVRQGTTNSVYEPLAECLENCQLIEMHFRKLELSTINMT